MQKSLHAGVLLLNFTYRSGASATLYGENFELGVDADRVCLSMGLAKNAVGRKTIGETALDVAGLQERCGDIDLVALPKVMFLLPLDAAIDTNPGAIGHMELRFADGTSHRMGFTPRGDKISFYLINSDRAE